MSAWDYVMPHRLLLNRSLRKASQELKDRIDAYQIEYSRRIEACNAELKEAEAEKNRQAEEFKSVLIQELNNEQKLLEDIRDDVYLYTDVFFQRAYLYQIQEIKSRQYDIHREDYGFLTEQMNIISREIDLLRERQNELTSFTSVDDIIHLAELSGYDLDFQPKDDAKSLLEKVSAAIKVYSGENNTEKFALLRLKTIIQERSDYLPTIDYISWVIRIKVQFRRQLSSRRSDIRNQQTALREELKTLKVETQSLTNQLNHLAVKVRYHWAKPITYLNADICYAYIELKEYRKKLNVDSPKLRDELHEKSQEKKDAISRIKDKKSRRRSVGSEIREMKESHSSDQWRWDSLQSEGRNLTTEIDSLSSDIDYLTSDIDSLKSELDSLKSAVEKAEATIASKKRERKEWAARRTHIVNLIRKYDKGFRSNRKLSEADEINIIETRLIELQKIREDGAVAARSVYEQEIQEIKVDHTRKIESLGSRGLDLQEKLIIAENECSTNAKNVDRASQQLQECIDADKRFALFKAISDTPEVAVAKTVLNNAKSRLAQATELKKSIDAQLAALQEEMEQENANYEVKVRQCKPQYLRPTGEEQLEEKKLSLRKEEIAQQSKGESYASTH